MLYKGSYVFSCLDSKLDIDIFGKIESWFVVEDRKDAAEGSN